MNRVLVLCALLASCGGGNDRPTTPDPGATYGGIERMRFNQLAVRLNLPLFWAGDADSDGNIDPDEIRALLFYPSGGAWVENGAFTEAFVEAFNEIAALHAAPEPEDERERLLAQEINSAAPTLLDTDLGELPPEHQAFARHMLSVAQLIDRIYAHQMGMDEMQRRVAPDPASQSVFRRNWGPECQGATTESNPACSAVIGGAQQRVDVYPASLQENEGFCATLESHPRHEELLSPFTVVRFQGDALTAVPYHEAYREFMAPIATELRAARDAMTDPEEEPLRNYLAAAAQAFTDNDWQTADEAWAAMSATNSRWYVRVAPDETYWEPCSQKAGFHLTFALIDRSSLAWQERLTPLRDRMEQSLDQLVEPYQARQVQFHLPDFIAIVVNAGDDRSPFGATIGQSLPNWGRVAGRGRTVLMSTLYTDEDSIRIRREQAASLFSAETMAVYSGDPASGNLSTILHEATHNLGPAQEYRVNGETADTAFGGSLASMLEELKAQSGALFFLAMLRENGIITEQQERETYLDSIAWALGHISRGMYTPSGQRKAYSQLSAIQVGFFMEHGVMRWDADAMAANGTDRGAFTIDFARFAEVARELMRVVVTIKATHARADAEALAHRFVDEGTPVPMQIIAERWQRLPRASFLYSVHE